MAQPLGAFQGELDGSGSVARLLLRFTAAGVVTVVLLAIGVAIVARMEAMQKGVDEARNTTWVVGHAIQPMLVPGLLSGDAGALAGLDRAVHRFVLGGSLVRVKVWDADGRILYSDAAVLIGQRFDLDAEARRALDQGSSVAGVSELEDPENVHEADFGRLLEVYLGLRTTTGQPVLFEAYYRYDEVVSASWETWRRFAPLAVGALLVLELVQVPLAVALARRLQMRRAAPPEAARPRCSGLRRRAAADRQRPARRRRAGHHWRHLRAGRGPDRCGRWRQPGRAGRGVGRGGTAPPRLCPVASDAAARHLSAQPLRRGARARPGRPG